MGNFSTEGLSELQLKSIEYEPTLDSTSDHARRILSTSNPPLPLLVITDQQTAGRGQPGKRWMSNEDSLTFTWCIDSNSLDGNSESVSSPSLPLIPLVAGIAVCESISLLGIEAERISLKWPNDVLIDDQKVAGILVESLLVGNVAKLLFGIGLNVNQRGFDSWSGDQEILGSKFPPTSLAVSKAATGVDFELQSVLIQVIASLNQQCKNFFRDGADTLVSINRWFRFSNQKIIVRLADEKLLTGICCGIGIDGELMLSIDRETHRIFSGTIVEISGES